MVFKAIGRNADDFDISFGKVIGATCNFTEFSCANWSEISRVREKDGLGIDQMRPEGNGA